MDRAPSYLVADLPAEFAARCRFGIRSSPWRKNAIQLATETKADVLVVDEWKGRAFVQSRGLPLVGALGVLGEAYQRGLIDDPLRILGEMRRHGFRISDQLFERFQVLLKSRYAR